MEKKAERVSNTNCSYHVSRKKPFRGNNLRGELLPSGIYVVYSYVTPIIVCKDDKWYQTEYKFSQTTSRQQNQALRGTDALKVSQGMIQELVK